MPPVPRIKAVSEKTPAPASDDGAEDETPPGKAVQVD